MWVVVSVSDTLKKKMGKKFQISLTNLLSLVLCCVTVGAIVGMVSSTMAWIIIGIFLMIIIYRLAPYITTSKGG